MTNEQRGLTALATPMHSTNQASQHTPGPWTQSEDQAAMVNAVFQGVWIKQGHMTLADVFTDIPEGAANARLIAAAPDLLAALISAEKRMSLNGFDEFLNDANKACIHQARAAIARARTNA